MVARRRRCHVSREPRVIVVAGRAAALKKIKHTHTNSRTVRNVSLTVTATRTLGMSFTLRGCGTKKMQFFTLSR